MKHEAHNNMEKICSIIGSPHIHMNTLLKKRGLIFSCLEMATVTAPGEYAKQGSKSRGYRHKEVIQHQREALSEMRARIRALEQTWPLKRFTQQGAPKKQAGSETSKLSTPRSAVSAWPLHGALGEETLERTARLDLSDALDLSERTVSGRMLSGVECGWL
ncbi:unnamed protein product [Oncorhynchus mykiss]|uniref:Uncharacterized protein n=1 Tax=Oncorhynchus mykiss TaxID=8022 RepID=A0A060WSK4_ONCMY|nr:unnamed protein product [Oncorhynchus mykiss]